MSLKNEWKQSGAALGHAVKGLGKNVIRSVEHGLDAMEGNAEESNVFNDGSWKKTGKELSKSLIGVGRAMVDSARVGLDKVDSMIEYEDDDE